MSQVQKGMLLGSPGPIGSPAIAFLYGAGSPLSNPDPNVANCQTGSLYTDYKGGTLWFRTTTGWQQITIP
jgi:hypothetical protein